MPVEIYLSFVSAGYILVFMELPKFKSAETFRYAVDSYFDGVEKCEKMPNRAGLCLHLGFSNWQEIRELSEKRRTIYREVARAALIIEDKLCDQLLAEDGKGANGAWKYLCSVFGYQERKDKKQKDLRDPPRLIRYPEKKKPGEPLRFVEVSKEARKNKKNKKPPESAMVVEEVDNGHRIIKMPNFPLQSKKDLLLNLMEKREKIKAISRKNKKEGK